MADKNPQSTKVLVGRLRRVAKYLDTCAAFDNLHEALRAPMRARANTCWQAAGRLQELDEKVDEAESYVASLEEHGNL